MANLEPIWNRARTDLLLATEQGEPDVFLWEHSARIARTALRIAEMVAGAGPAADPAVLIAAGLYHDAGWAVRYASGDVLRHEILTRTPPDSHREQSAVLLERSLDGLISRDQLALAAHIVRSLSDRDLHYVEGQIISEAENLDEFGVVSLWVTVRRGAWEGKGVKAAVDTWRRRKEYQFWSARLSDSFRFPAVREIARRRLAQLERVMDELELQQQGGDLLSGGELGSLPSSAFSDRV